MSTKTAKITVVGVVSSIEYQKCKYLAEQLVMYLPDIFCSPQLRPMLDVAWTEWRWKIRRRLGGHTWDTNENVAVFIDGTYLGSSTELQQYVDHSFCLRVHKNFEALALIDLKKYLDKFEVNSF